MVEGGASCICRRFCNFALTKEVKYFLGVIALLVAGCSGKGEYIRMVESKLDLIERHLSKGERSEARELLLEINLIMAGAVTELIGIVSEINNVLSELDEGCPSIRANQG